MSFDPISAALDIGKMAISRIWPDPAQQADAHLKLAKLAQGGDLAELDAHVKSLVGQLEINKIEAAHGSIFVSGARPFVMWICSFALAYASIIEPIARFAAKVYFDYHDDFPAINTDITLQVLLGMLGLGSMRSYDKLKKTDTKKLR